MTLGSLPLATRRRYYGVGSLTQTDATNAVVTVLAGTLIVTVGGWLLWQAAAR